jgi:hypothetical protein
VPRVTFALFGATPETGTFFGKHIVHTFKGNWARGNFGNITTTRAAPDPNKWTKDAIARQGIARNKSAVRKRLGSRPGKAARYKSLRGSSLRNGHTGLDGVLAASKTIASGYARFYGNYFNPKSFLSPKAGAKYRATEKMYESNTTKGAFERWRDASNTGYVKGTRKPKSPP